MNTATATQQSYLYSLSGKIAAKHGEQGTAGGINWMNTSKAEASELIEAALERLAEPAATMVDQRWATSELLGYVDRADEAGFYNGEDAQKVSARTAALAATCATRQDVKDLCVKLDDATFDLI
jgi:hypothetical protein